MIDKHGLKMMGLKKASGNTYNCKDDAYTQISYDTRDGEILTDWHHETNEWTSYKCITVIGVCNTRHHMTMQEIADKIAEAVKEIEIIESYKSYEDED